MPQRLPLVLVLATLVVGFLVVRPVLGAQGQTRDQFGYALVIPSTPGIASTSGVPAARSNDVVGKVRRIKIGSYCIATSIPLKQLVVGVSVVGTRANTSVASWQFGSRPCRENEFEVDTSTCIGTKCSPSNSVAFVVGPSG
jgi:hypothetical protein